MGILPEALLRGGDAHLGQELQSFIPGPGTGHGAVQVERFHDLAAHAVDRIERAHGVLGDHSHPAAPDAVQVVGGHGQNVPPLEQDPAVHQGRGRQKPHGGQAGHALAAAALAHQTQGLPFVQGQVQLPDGPQAAVFAAFETDDE